MENDYLVGDICISDRLPCSCQVKGVGIGVCVKNSHGKIIICCRFSDVSDFERSFNIYEYEEIVHGWLEANKR